MKHFFKIIALVFFVNIISVGCNDKDDSLPPTSIQDFVWKGLNFYYLYQPQVPNLSDGLNSSQNNLNNFLSNYSTPETLFESLLFNRQTVDKFSVIFSNYTQLENLLSGNTKSNGLELGFAPKAGSATDIFGYVKYVMPNSDAASKPISRGVLFSAINGQLLTRSNFRNLINQDSYTLNLADYNSGAITPNGQSVSLTKSSYTENPVLLKNTHTIGARKMGYLVYNGFYANFETELNNAFAYFKGENVSDLILDLRYNSGGRIDTATRLASMITGQFDGQIFSQQQWNPKIQARLSPESLYDRFTLKLGNGAAINSLNLSKVYVLTTASSASASELVINCLKPYINVVQIGTKTLGKNVGSITIYDSPTFRKRDVNPNHNYAMQPIVIKTLNIVGFGDYSAGISPDANNILSENLGNLGVLGDPTETLLAKALNIISLGGKAAPANNYKVYEEIIDKSNRNLESEMYLNY